MGATTNLQEDSSGLHHDFHDNLLVLVCGRKRFLVWDPTANMRPAGGPPVRLYANGRPVYASSPDVHADGRDFAADKAATVRKRLDDVAADDDELLERLLDDALDAETRPSPRKRRRKTPDNFATLSSEDGYPRGGLAEFVLGPGDALYLPCGWWHEVRSGGGVHCAFNYWFHPPDFRAPFHDPYRSPFWRDDWQRRSQDDPLLRGRRDVGPVAVTPEYLRLVKQRGALSSSSVPQTAPDANYFFFQR